MSFFENRKTIHTKIENETNKRHKALQEELKIKQIQLNTLGLQIKNSPYNRNPKILEKKREDLINRINEIKQILLHDINE
jgi:hypothetical protein